MSARWLLAVVVLASAVSLAEDPKARAAREELERQLRQMVDKAPTRVRVELEALDEPNYVLEEAAFELDGRSLGAPTLGQLNREGTHLVWSGDVAPGKHVVAARLVYANGTSIVLSDEGGYKWKVGGSVSFDVNAGIEVQVKVTPLRDGAQTDIAKRFRLSLPAKPVMLAKLDDGSMPEPLAKPVIDAGPSAAELAAATAQAAAAEKARLVAEAEAAKQRQAEEAAEAKRLAAEAKQRQAEEAAEAKRLAAEAKQRQAEELADAKRLTAEERRQKAEEARRLGTGGAGAPLAEVAPPPEAPPPEPAPAPVEVPEAVDAGTTVAVAPAPAPTEVAVTPTPAPDEEAFPWTLALGAAAGGLAVFLVLLARRSSRPPKLDD